MFALVWLYVFGYLLITFHSCECFRLNVTPISTCPLNKCEWEKRELSFKCVNLVYHCFPTSEKFNGSTEFCAKRETLRPKDGCPWLDIKNDASTYSYFKCKHHFGCPRLNDMLYLSSTIYKYPSCLSNNYSKEVSVNRSLEHSNSVCLHEEEIQKMPKYTEKYQKPFERKVTLVSKYLTNIYSVYVESSSFMHESGTTKTYIINGRYRYLVQYGKYVGGLIGCLLSTIILLTMAVCKSRCKRKQLEMDDFAEQQNDEQDYSVYDEINEMNTPC